MAVQKWLASFVFTDTGLSQRLQSYLNVISKAIEGASMEIDYVCSIAECILTAIRSFLARADVALRVMRHVVLILREIKSLGLFDCILEPH